MSGLQKSSLPPLGEGRGGGLSDVKRELLEARLRQRRERLAPLVGLRPRGERAPFFCVHASSGSVFPYAGLAARMGEDQPFWGLEARGFDGGRAPLDRFEDMASCYVAAVREQQQAGPYRLGGWSIGAVVAVEMARQLAAAGQEVATVVMIDVAVLDPTDPADPVKCLRWLVKDLASMVGAPVPDVEDVLRLPAGRRETALRSRLVGLGLVPKEVDAATFERRAAVHEANIMAFHRYRPARYDGRAAVLWAEGSGFDPVWRTLAPAARFEVVPGDHYTILRPPHVDRLAAGVRAALA